MGVVYVCIIPPLPHNHLHNHLHTTPSTHSLNPGVPRLTFTIEFDIDPTTGTVQQRRPCRSVIQSCAKLTYGVAQSMLDGMFDEKAQGVPTLHGGHAWQQVGVGVGVYFVGGCVGVDVWMCIVWLYGWGWVTRRAHRSACTKCIHNTSTLYNMTTTIPLHVHKTQYIYTKQNTHIQHNHHNCTHTGGRGCVFT